MKILLDTHIALWAIADTSKLPDKVIKLLEEENNEVFYSMASVWEIAIKHIINRKTCLYQRKNLYGCVRIRDLPDCR